MDSKVKGLWSVFFFFNFNPFPLLFRTRGDKRQRKRRGKDNYNTGTTGPWPGEEGGGGRQVNFRVVRYTRIDSIGKNIFSIGKLEVDWQLLEVEMIKYTGCQ